MMAGFGQVRSDVYDRVSRSQYYRDNLAGLTAHQRHQRLLAELNKGSQQDPDAVAAAALASTVTDEDVLRQHHRFLRTAADDAQDNPADWGVRLAKRYYARLFKEYAIVDLSRYKESKVGVRWRTKAEVESGKGQFTCGAKGCNESLGLASYEINFSYAEAGQSKQALVKVRLCPDCAAKLNSTHEKEYRRVGQVEAALQQHQEGRRESLSEDWQQHKRQKRNPKSKERSRDRGKAEELRGGDDGVKQDRSSSDISKRQRQSGDWDHAQQEQQRLHSSSPQAAAVPPPAIAERWVQGESDAADKEQKAKAVSDGDIERWLDDVFAAS